MSKEGLMLRSTTQVPVCRLIFMLGIIAQCASGAQIRYPEFIDIFDDYRSAIILHNTVGLMMMVFLFLLLLVKPPCHINQKSSIPGNNAVKFFCMAVLCLLLGLSGILLMNIITMWQLVFICGGPRLLATLHFLAACILISLSFNNQFVALLRTSKIPSAVRQSPGC